MKRFIRLAAMYDRLARRFRTTLLVMGVACFAIITADHANFIDLPKLAKIPLWIGVILNIARWAIWEGIAKPSVQAAVQQRDRTTHPEP